MSLSTVFSNRSSINHNEKAALLDFPFLTLFQYNIPLFDISLFDDFAILLLLSLILKQFYIILLASKNLHSIYLPFFQSLSFFPITYWGKQLFWLAFQLDSKSLACFYLFSFFHKLPWLFSMVSSIRKTLQWFREQDRNIYISYIMYQLRFGKWIYLPLRARFSVSVVLFQLLVVSSLNSF
jgi:hypothetical protein